MEISTNRDNKIVEIWLNQAESRDAALQKQLKELSRSLSGQNYTVAILHSGNQELYRQTQALLRYNKKRIAELEVQRLKPSSNTTD